MTDLPTWVVTILTMVLRDWVDEQGGSGSIEDAALYFGVDPEDIRAAIAVTGALDIKRSGGVDLVVSSMAQGRS